MNNLNQTNSFIFRQTFYTESHKRSFPNGVAHNYIVWFKEGEARITSDDADITLKPGDIMHIPKKAKYDFLSFGYPRVCFNTYAYLNYPDNLSYNYKIQKIEPSPKIIRFLQKIPVGKDADCQSIGIFYLLLHELLKKMEASDSGKREILKKAMDYIVMNSNNNIPEVAYYCSISESTLYALFRDYANTTPSKFKMRVKLEKALNYLVSTDVPIETISEICGFSSSSYFRKQFIKMYKKTPSEMRKGSIL